MRESGRPSGPLQVALSETGAIGSTVRQLADRVERPPDDVVRTLELWRSQGDVRRIGRGLWILSEYVDLATRTDFVQPAEFNERFLREGGVVLAKYDGPITFSANDSLPVHRWWPYVQGYSGEFVRELFDRFDLPRGSTVLDPFAGSGTTLVEARLAGHRAVGFELLPPARLAAQVKTRLELNPKFLALARDRVIELARRRPPGPLPFLRETRRQFPADALADLTRLRDALPREGRPVSDAVRVAFGKVLIPSSRLRRSPCLGYGNPPKARVGAPFDLFRAAIDEMIDDLSSLAPRRRTFGPAATVAQVDARAIRLPSNRVDLAVTSPPYVNGMDYVTNYKVDMAWLGYARSYADLVRLRQSLVACDNLPRADAGRFLTVADAPDPWLREILAAIRRNVARKGSYRRDDAHGIVKRYFLDLIPVLTGVFRSLKAEGRFVLVIGDSLIAGTYVPGDLLIARLGAQVGFAIDSVEVARSRRSGQRRSFELRESIVTLRKPRGR